MNIQNRPVVVTLHAVRRFAERVLGFVDLPEDDGKALGELERVHGVDTREIRQLLRDRVQRGVYYGASSVRIGRIKYIIEGRTLVTVAEIVRVPKVRKGRIDRDRE